MAESQAKFRILFIWKNMQLLLNLEVINQKLAANQTDFLKKFNKE